MADGRWPTGHWNKRAINALFIGLSPAYIPEPMTKETQQEVATKVPLEPIGGTLMLQHAYSVDKRIRVTSLFAEYSARQETFGRPVRMRLYKSFKSLSFTPGAEKRIRGIIERGGEGTLTIDVGEMEDGHPFLVTQPPSGEPLKAWWKGQAARPPELLAAVGLAIREALEQLRPAQQREATLDKLFVEEDERTGLRIQLYAFGELPTRAEVRMMSGLAPRDLALGFPPECFAVETSVEDELESTEAADVYRLGAILYELESGNHPLFKPDDDVAKAAARLVSDLEPHPKQCTTSKKALNECISSAIAVDPVERPSLAECLAELGAAADPTGETDAIQEPESASRSESASVSGRTMRLVLFVTLLLMSCGATYLLSNRPPQEVSVLVTSEPTGIRFEQVLADGQSENLGRTPLIVADVPIDGTFSIRPLYEDGEVGTTQQVQPNGLQVFEGCRGVHFNFE